MLDKIIDDTIENFGKLKEGQAFDPATIMIIIEIVMQIIEALNENCAEDNPDAAADIVRHPSKLGVRILKRKVHRALGRQDYKAYGEDMVSALLETGRNITVEEMREAYLDLL